MEIREAHFWTSKHWKERQAYAQTMHEQRQADVNAEVLARLEILESNPLTRVWSYISSLRVKLYRKAGA